MDNSWIVFLLSFFFSLFILLFILLSSRLLRDSSAHVTDNVTVNSIESECAWRISHEYYITTRVQLNRRRKKDGKRKREKERLFTWLVICRTLVSSTCSWINDKLHSNDDLISLGVINLYPPFTLPLQCNLYPRGESSAPSLLSLSLFISLKYINLMHFCLHSPLITHQWVLIDNELMHTWCKKTCLSLSRSFHLYYLLHQLPHGVIYIHSNTLAFKSYLNANVYLYINSLNKCNCLYIFICQILLSSLHFVRLVSSRLFFLFIVLWPASIIFMKDENSIVFHSLSLSLSVICSECICYVFHFIARHHHAHPHPSGVTIASEWVRQEMKWRKRWEGKKERKKEMKKCLWLITVTLFIEYAIDE